MKEYLFLRGKTVSGFTLLEILIVIALLAVIAVGAVLAINPAKRIRQAQDSRVKKDIAEISTALEAYYTRNLYYPNNLSVLASNGDLKTISSPPTGGSYSISTNPGVCTSETKDCEAAVSFPLADPASPGGLWCWRSINGSASEAASCLP